MKKLIPAIIVAVVVLSSCQYFGGAPKGYHKVSIENGKIEVNLPDDFSVRKDSVYHMDPAKNKDMHTFRFSNKNDSTKIISFGYSTNADAKITVDKYMNNVKTEAAQSPMVRLKGNDTLSVNGTKFAVVTFTVLKDSVESDFSRIIFGVVNSEVYTCNIAFKGKSVPEYSTIAETVTKSYTFKK